MNKRDIINKVIVKLSKYEIKKPENLTKEERKDINEDFRKAGLDGNGRFKKIDHGLQKIGEILDKYNIEWDEILSSDKFRGDSGKKTLEVARKNKEDKFSPTSIKNSLVSFSWHVLHEKNITDMVKDKTYEILAYMS